MRRHVIAVPLALALGTTSSAAEEEPGAAPGEPPTSFDRYWMVFLERGDDPPELDEAERAALQRAHLAHLDEVWRDGYSLVAGPFDNGPDGALRGIVLYRGDLSKDEVLDLAGADPAVKAGRLKVRTLPWYTGAGMLTFEAPPEDPRPSDG